MKDEILNYLSQSQDWKRKGEIEDYLRGKGYLMDTLGRCLRSLAQKNLIKVDYYKSAVSNQKLARYASLNVEKPKKRILVLTDDGRAVYTMV